MVTTLGGRVVALGASAVAHAAIVVAAASGGHAAPARASVADTRELSVDVVEPPPPVVEEPPSVGAHAPASAHTHTHSYPVDPDHDARPHDPSIVHARHALPAPHVPASPDTAPLPVLAAAPQPASSEPPRFTMAIGGATSRSSAVTSAVTSAEGGAGEPHGDGDLGEVLPAAAVPVPARCAGSAPAYTREAASAAVEADVPLEIVVDARGRVRDAKVLAPVGYGLDRSAIAGALAMQCTPAQRAGRAVSVRMRWVTAFRLQ